MQLYFYFQEWHACAKNIAIINKNQLKCNKFCTGFCQLSWCFKLRIYEIDCWLFGMCLNSSIWNFKKPLKILSHMTLSCISYRMENSHAKHMFNETTIETHSENRWDSRNNPLNRKIYCLNFQFAFTLQHSFNFPFWFLILGKIRFIYFQN